ncbi:MAG: hypothetical protein Q4G42_08975 [Neisseria sp.]|nr:hypothetical protein [Neisseria sp.]
MQRLLIALLCAFGFQAAFAADLVVPQKLNFNGETYYLNFQNTEARPQVFEYTLRGETVENWSKLLTLQYAKDMQIDLNAYGAIAQQQMQQNPQILASDVFAQNDAIYIRQVFKPVAEFPHYESNTHKSFISKSCNNELINYITAIRYPAENTPLERIKQDNDQMMEKLLVDTWQPTCR